MKKHHPKVVQGTAASAGIGIGTAWILEDEETIVRPEKIEKEEVEQHLEKFENAKKSVIKDYLHLKKMTDDEDVAAIIEAQIQTLKDPELNSLIEAKIHGKKYGVIYAVFSTFNEYIQLMETSDARWLNDRSIDVISIRDQLIHFLQDRRKKQPIPKKAVVLAREVSPTVLIQLSRMEISGIVMEKGGLTSHAVILSQSLGIPCVVGAPWKKYQIHNGTEAILDGVTGEVIFKPFDSQREEFKQREASQKHKLEENLKWTRKPHEALCGTKFTLRANIEFLEELSRLAPFGAKGVGLLRTETILFQTEKFDVNEQVDFYSKVAEASNHEPVTIRLFDAGGDKLLDNVASDANPFLGWRGVRMLLDEKVLLEKQLEAIYRVSGLHKGKLKILIPMISSLEEVIAIKKHIEEVKTKLLNDSVEIDPDVPIGIMVEVPSTALMAKEIGRHADFFSIGTNDLTQYTLAVDRVNEKISHLFQPNHPSVWKLIKMIKEGADHNNIPVAVCGEMASDPKAAACFLGLGINDLSMNTGAIPGVKAVLCKHTITQMQEFAALVLEAEQTAQIIELFKHWGNENPD
ncbi:MAG: phosphoenolpyruvate--protein phosphotransferase [Balneolaceae bacterium]